MPLLPRHQRNAELQAAAQGQSLIRRHNLRVLIRQRRIPLIPPRRPTRRRRLRSLPVLPVGSLRPASGPPAPLRAPQRPLQLETLRVP